jgi:hypothetical protein
MESASDQKIRERLISSVSYVLGNSIIHTFLERTFGALSSAYVLGHTPDQGEDLYVALGMDLPLPNLSFQEALMLTQRFSHYQR